MKLQGLSVFFCLIAVPVILVLSYYVQAQVNTIALQTAYDTKLLDATHDAMVALEINTANEDLSTVSDALRSIVTASTNTFINSLATNLGMSNATKSSVQPYIPAILVTLYDGYYIYSPTKTPKICTNDEGQAVYVGDKGVVDVGSVGSLRKYTYTYTDANDDGENDVDAYTVNTLDYGSLLYKLEGTNQYTTSLIETTGGGTCTDFKTDYVLKSYIPYAARYVKGSIDVVINYTLDNYITIYGNIGDVYYTKSGYYSDAAVSNIKVNGSAADYLKHYSDTEIEEFCLAQNNMQIDVTLDGRTTTIHSDSDDAKKAIAYYMRSYVFSNWVETKLDGLLESDIRERVSTYNNDSYGDLLLGNDDTAVVTDVDLLVMFDEKHNEIFNATQNPEVEDSTFSLHKRDVMRNSIQYNLNLSMSAYNQMSLNSVDFRMPVIDDVSWDALTSKISVLTFMQGFACGMKTYNNFALVSSTNNEFTVIPEEIYYVTKGSESGINDQVTKYHRIDCPTLEATLNNDLNKLEETVTSFKSKEVKYDKIYDKYEATYKYDHKNIACYDCIISGNYETPRKIEGEDKTGYYHTFNYHDLSNKQLKAYMIAIGKERQSLYRTNAIVNTQGTQVKNFTNVSCTGNSVDIDLPSGIPYKDIKSIEIVIAETGEYHFPIATLRATVGPYWITNKESSDAARNFRVVANQKKEQTLVLNFSEATNSVTVNGTNPDGTTDVSIDYNRGIQTNGSSMGDAKLRLVEENNADSSDTFTFKVKSVKINYK